jgi:8-oxo-dGTP pyrophosphatase MutT (NUDIX family)
MKEYQMRIDIRTAAILKDQSGRLLLLRRSPDKKLLPNLITGIGGKVELQEREGENIEESLKRELREEVPQIDISTISNFRLRLTTHQSRGDHVVVLFWYTGTLETDIADLSCTEGQLIWCDPTDLPVAEMTPAARDVIPFIALLSPDDMKLYDGVYEPDTTKLTVS